MKNGNTTVCRTKHLSYDLDMTNCFGGMVDWRKAFCVISSRDDCQRSSSSRISNTPQTGFEPLQNLSPVLDEWSYTVVITTKTPCHFGKIYGTKVHSFNTWCQKVVHTQTNLPLCMTFLWTPDIKAYVYYPKKLTYRGQQIWWQDFDDINIFPYYTSF